MKISSCKKGDVRGMNKIKKILTLILILIAVLLAFPARTDIEARGIDPKERINAEAFMCEATAYCYDNITASGEQPVAGKTIAGAKEWIGCVACVYSVSPEGGIGDFIGYYEINDTGYGKDGDIRRGETIDFFMETKADCMNWGRRNVYVKIIRGNG